MDVGNLRGDGESTFYSSRIIGKLYTMYRLKGSFKGGWETSEVTGNLV